MIDNLISEEHLKFIIKRSENSNISYENFLEMFHNFINISIGSIVIFKGQVNTESERLDRDNYVFMNNTNKVKNILWEAIFATYNKIIESKKDSQKKYTLAKPVLITSYYI